MNLIQRIVKNAMVLSVATLVNGTLTFFSVMYTARYLGVEDFGVLSFALAFTEIFIVFSDFGLSTLMTREVAKEKSLASQYLGNITVMKICLVIITLGLIVIVINLFDYPKKVILVVYLMSLALICTSFRRMFNAIFRAFEKMEYVSIGEILNGGFLLIGTIYAIRHQWEVASFALMYFLCSLLILGYASAICHWKFVSPTIMKIDLRFWKKTINEAWPLGAMAICILIYFRIDTVMLSLMKGEEAVGIYSAAYRISEITTIIPSLFIASIFPVMSKYHKDSPTAFLGIYQKIVKYLFFVSFPMVLMITFFAGSIIRLIYGDKFLGSEQALQTIIWASAIMYVTMVLGTTSVAANKQKTNFKLAIIAVILNILLNLALIPSYSYVGAAVATIITEAFGLVVGIYFLTRWGYKLNLSAICLPPFYGGCGCGIIALVLSSIGAHPLFILTAVLVVYGTIVYKTGIQEEDIRLIKGVFLK